jgi:hypothetical protein
VCVWLRTGERLRDASAVAAAVLAIPCSLPLHMQGACGGGRGEDVLCIIDEASAQAPLATWQCWPADVRWLSYGRHDGFSAL